MKRFSIVIIFIIILSTMNFAVAETHPLATNFTNIQDILYLENGDVIYSKFNGSSDEMLINQTLDKIICVNSKGKQMWECEIPAFSYSPFSSLIELPDNRFAYLGKRDNGTFSVLTISKDGKLIKEYILPEEMSTPILLSDGVIYISAKENKIKKWFWNEGIISPEPNEVFSQLVKAETVLNHTYISAVSNNELFLLCIDESGEEIWNYSLGKAKDNFVQTWYAHDDNSLIVAYQKSKNTDYGLDESTCLIKISNGEKKWETTLSNYPSTVRAHVFVRNDDNTYLLLGRLDENHGVSISISTDGEIIECVTMKAHCVDFVQYKNNIYAIEYSTEGAISPTSLIRYDLMQKQPFDLLGNL